MAATHVLHSFWRRHRWTALRSLLLVALLHRLHFLAFLAASSPVWLLTAFLLGAVLVNSEPNVPLGAAASEDHEGRHLTTSSSSSDDDESEEDVDEDHLVVHKKEAVAWTADDEHSIQSIGSLELERDARLEKLMSRRTVHRNLIHLDVHTPTVLAPRTKNPFDLDHDAAMDAPGSAPSSLLGQHTSPFDIHIQQPDEVEEDTEDDKKEAMLGRHDSFTAGAAPLAQPSRFKPYFVADVPEEEGGGRDAGSDNSNSNSNSSSPSSSTASDHQTQQEAAVKVEEAPAAMASTWDGKGNGMVVAVDVELISDSSDDDMSLQADDATGGNAHDPSDEDEEDSFEVESITQQVAAAKQQQQQLQPPRVTAVVEPVSPPSEQGHRHRDEEDKEVASIVSGRNERVPLVSVEEKEKRERERELTENREHRILGAVPVIDSSAGARVGAAGAVVAAAPTPPAAAAAAGPPPVAAAPTPPATDAAAGPPQPAAAAPTPRPTAAVASAPPSGKLSSKSKVASKKIDPKKAVFGFFRK